MVELFGRFQGPGRGWAVRLPEGGFEHPFRDSTPIMQWQGKEQPRTVSVLPPPELLQVFDIAPPDHRAADVRTL